MNKGHPFDRIEIRSGNEEEVRGLLRLLPEDTFRFTDRFLKGSLETSEDYCGETTIYARKEPILGENAISIIAVNEHLFGNSVDGDDNPLFRVPDGAKEVYLVPPRAPPLKKSHPFMGTEFSYKGAKFFLGYELSERAYEIISEGISRKFREEKVLAG